MKYAVLSDIHANLEALSAVFKRIEKEGVDKILCLGDIVGYNTNPIECIALIRERGVVAISGNHDSRSCFQRSPKDFSLLAKNAILWTQEQLEESNREYLASLPHSLSLNDDILIVHGSLQDQDEYIVSMDQALHNFALMQKDSHNPSICFFGHTHQKKCFHLGDKNLAVEPPEKIVIESGHRYLINPGSVGQPRDRDNRASFLIFNSKRRRIRYYCVPYDIGTTQRKIVEAGLDYRLAERLELGW